MSKVTVLLSLIVITSCSDRLKYKVSKQGAIGEIVCDASVITKAPYAGGEGSREKPFLICTPTQLAAIASRTSDFQSHFKLLSDVDMSAENFDGIGSSASPFMGHFDGNSKTISRLTISRIVGDGVGFFNETSRAQITDLTFQNVSVTASSSDNVGVVTGKAVESFIKNVNVINANVAGVTNTGTLAGHSNLSTFFNTSASGTIVGDYSVGGAIGTLELSVILNSDISADVNSEDAVGGVVGSVDMSNQIQNVHFSGNVVGMYSVGGLIGESFGNLNLYRSSFNGFISGDEYTGGIMGTLYRPARIGSVSVNYTMTGRHYLGGVVGEYYGDSEISDVIASGTITSTGTFAGSVGGFFGSLDDWGSVENSLAVVTINGTPEYAGGFAGRRFSGADPFTVNDVAVVSNVAGNSAYDILGLFTGGGFSDLYNGTSYFWSGGVCNNNGTGDCVLPVQTPIADLTDFYDNSKLPFLNWDFSDIWQSNAMAYPSLRQVQLHPPSTSTVCSSFALKNLPYSCELHIVDADQHEIQMIDLNKSTTCSWMFRTYHALLGIPSNNGSCRVDYQITDGTHSSEPRTLNLSIQDEISVSPLYDPNMLWLDLGNGPIGMTASIQTITITNTKADPLNGFSIGGLTQGSFTRTGGSCGALIPPGSSCTVEIDFTPSLVDLNRDKMTINYLSGSVPVSIDYNLGGAGY